MLDGGEWGEVGGWGLGFMVLDFRARVLGLGFGVWGIGFREYTLGFRV
jgi:hypothetical protein